MTACQLVGLPARRPCRLVGSLALHYYILQQTEETLAIFFHLFLFLIERPVQQRLVNLSTRWLVQGRDKPSRAEPSWANPDQPKIN
jgi:hypothetical protein